jgi:glycosyltransferase involved in cell wall biosynthesis
MILKLKASEYVRLQEFIAGVKNKTSDDLKLKFELEDSAPPISFDFNASEKITEKENSSPPVQRPVFFPPQRSASIAVVVTCHSDYLPYLEECVKSVDAQTFPAAEKILVFDSCESRAFPGWKVLSGQWGTPNPARNAGANSASAEWIVTVDADNWLHPRYLEGISEAALRANEFTGIIYADIEGYEVIGGPRKWIQPVPDSFDYWSLRLANYISGTSAIRKSAMVNSGGWQKTMCYDDWALVHNITARGWGCVKQYFPILVRENGGHRRGRSAGADFPFKWNQRSYGIVSLLAGRANCFSDWKNFLLSADLPSKISLYVLDNSCNPRFSEKLRGFLISPQVNSRFESIHFSIVYKKIDLNSHKFSRAEHVAWLYNRILPQISEDMAIMLEDDVVPPLDAVKRIVSEVPAKTKIGAVSGAYLSRRGKGRITAAFGLDFYDRRIFTKDLQDKIMQVGCIAGGFTVVNNALLKKCLPFRFGYLDNIPTGWDSYFSRQIQSLGFAVCIHGGIQCAHNFEEQT